MLSAPIDSVRVSFCITNTPCSHKAFLSHCCIESAGVRNIAPPSRIARQQNYIPCSVKQSSAKLFGANSPQEPHGIRVFFMLSAPIDSVRVSFCTTNTPCSHKAFLSHCSIESSGVRNIAPPSRPARQQNYIPCSVEQSPQCFSAQILRRSRMVFAYRYSDIE